MGAARKLQNEIEGVLKKVKEGVASFDDTHSKLMSLDAPQQREKLVASLKDQIKKLQKDRDKIKTWASDKDVRDKKNLTDARAMIERRMEKFKECEKELKVKDFSKVGLEKGAKLDPRQAATDERREWIRCCVERIDGTVEINEAEVDGILANVKRGKEPPSRVGSIQARNALHKKHTERLEQVLRALDNEAITVEQVDGLKEAIEDYCENGNVSGEDTFYDEVDALYDEEILSIIDSVDVHVPIVTERVAPRVPEQAEKPDKKNRDKEREQEKARKEEREKEREKEKAEKQLAIARVALPAKGHSAYPTEEKAAAQQRVATLIKDPPPPPPPRTGPQAAALLTNQPGTTVPASQQPEAASTATATRAAVAPVGSAWVGATPSAASTAVAASSISTAAPSVVDASPVQPAVAAAAPGLPSPTPAVTVAPPPAPPAPHPLAASAAPPGLPVKVAPAQDLPTRAEPSAGAMGNAQMPPLEPTSIMMTLMDKRPHPFDSVWLRHPCARRTRAPSARPLSYPSVPPAILDSPRFYNNITKDTDIDLFYIFYLTPGTQYQYLAAYELRQRNWRYHKEEKAWFQRAEMPSESTNTYEKGDYVYFDPTCQTDTSWVLRFKKDFKVEYSMVEGDAWCEAGAYSVMTKS